MPVVNCRFLSLILSTLLVSHGFSSASVQDESEPVRQTKRIRRVLYNFDGDRSVKKLGRRVYSSKTWLSRRKSDGN